MELKPCPFCGGSKIEFMVSGHFQPWERECMKLWYHCMCSDCGCEMDDGGCADMRQAAKRWNRRAGEEDKHD